MSALELVAAPVGGHPVDVALLERCRELGLVVDAPEALRGWVPAGAVFDCDELYRYVLVRRWAEGPVALFVMLNPSTATALVDDHTIRRCVGFAKRECCGALVVVNLFALRSKKPEDLAGAMSPVGAHNDEVLRTAFALAAAAAPAGPVVVAWGEQKELGGREVAVARMLGEARLTAQCLGVTAGGCPRHPSRRAKLEQLVPYQLPVVDPKGWN